MKKVKIILLILLFSVVSVYGQKQEYKFKGINLLDYVEVMKKVTFEEVTERLNDHFKEENCVISIAEPK